MTRNEQITEAKIGQLYGLGLIEEDDVLGLQVSVDDVQLMAVSYCTDNLHHNMQSKLFQ